MTGQAIGQDYYRVNRRLTIGNATLIDDENVADDTWLSSTSVGAQWIPRNATFAVMIPFGSAADGANSPAHARGIALAGLSNSAFMTTTAIGVAGYAIGNNSSLSAFGGYSECQFQDGTYGYGHEVIIKNQKSNVTITPYSSDSGGAIGLQVNADGDTSYGGAASYPAAAYSVFVGNDEGANRGIVVKSGCIPTGIFLDLPDDYELRLSNTAGTNSSIQATGTGSNMTIELKPAGTGTINISTLPTSSAGLSSGDVWNDSGTLKIV